MTRTPANSDGLPPLLILATPAGITTLWVLPVHYGWGSRDAAVAAVAVFFAVLALPRVSGALGGAAKAAVRKRRASSKKDGKNDKQK
ncbi:hypothetical protein [Streptomyces sp. NPDC093223]|uniref:hypothetical protein n=1 Tax=Streptomyces sp. NPDC093223 TaxID=3366033 RepID=UPI003811D5D1